MSSACPSSSTQVVLPSHSNDVGRYNAASSSHGSRSLVNHRSSTGSGRVREDHIGQESERAA